MANWWEADPVTPAETAGKAWWEADPVAAPAGSGRDFEDTALIRGLQATGSFLADPMAMFRSFVSPELAKIEQGEAAQAKVPPPAEIIRRAGDAAFPAFGVQEYQPQSPREGLGQAALTGAVAGAPAGLPGMAVGAAGGALGYGVRESMGEPKPGEVDWTTRAEMLASMLPGGVANRMGVRARSRTTPELEAAGVNPTFGQAMGGAWNKIEQALSSIPFIGDAMQRGRAGAVEQFNIGNLNRVLEPLGQELPRGTQAGRPAIEKTHELVTGRYNALAPQITIPSLDQAFHGGVNQIRRDATMNPNIVQQLENIIDLQINQRRDPNTGVLTGQAYRDAESNLGRISRENRHTADADQRALGNLVLRVQDELRQQLERANPNQRAELQNIHRAYSELLRVETAAAKPGTGQGGRSEYGVYSPAQYTQAIRDMDPTLRHGGFARGQARGQELAEAARRLLGDTVPDSGTPYRLAVGSGAFGGAGLLADPTTTAGLGAGYAASRLAYSPQGRAAMNYFLRRPEQAGFAGLLAGQEDYLLPPPR